MLLNIEVKYFLTSVWVVKTSAYFISSNSFQTLQKGWLRNVGCALAIHDRYCIKI